MLNHCLTVNPQVNSLSHPHITGKIIAPLNTVFICISTVSYTHLDVYKRQDWRGGILAAFTVSFPLMYRTARGAFESFDETLAPVSYTHLDVYKRQSSACSSVSAFLQLTPST